MTLAVHYSSRDHQWGTPPDLFALLDREFLFTLDVAASPENAKCPRYFTEDDDGLAQDWRGETCWMNPPYGRQIGAWMRKAHYAQTTVVCLVPARTDTAWWWRHAIHGEVRFLRGRLAFTGGTQVNPESHNAPFPVAVVVFGRPPRVIWWDQKVSLAGDTLDLGTRHSTVTSTNPEHVTPQ